MNHVSTVCTHCADGCKVTLGVRQSNDGSEIIRADNRDKSGINGDFLCAKGRFGFDFVESSERLTKPLIRNSDGKLVEATWEHALRLAASKLKEIRDNRTGTAGGGSSIGVIGSNRATNEENYLLQKFARTVLHTNSIDHERTADYAAFAHALAGHPGKAATLRDCATAPAILLIGGNPTDEHPLLAWNLRTNVRLNRGRLYIANSRPIKLERQAAATLRLPADSYSALPAYLDGGDTILDNAAFREALLAEPSLLVLFGSEYTGAQVAELVAWGLKRENIRFAYLGAYANSRGAADLGLLPDLLPGYVPVSAPGAFAEYPNLSATHGNSLSEMIDSAANGELGALLVSGADPFAKLGNNSAASHKTFLIVADLFLTKTAALADVVFPAASLYESSGTVTNTFGDLQFVRKAADRAGVKSGFEILVRLAGAMGVDVKSLVPFGNSSTTADLGQSRGAHSGEADRHAIWLAANNLEPRLSPFDPLAVLDEIERLVPGYQLDRINLFGGNDQPTEPGANFVPVEALTQRVELAPAHDGLFTSGSLSQYSDALKQLNHHQSKYAGLKIL
jgi:NADH-quinone oxidoreductase subunit G